MTIPKVGITLGDPGGVGPEIVLKAFSGKYSLPRADYILFGSSLVIEEAKKALGIELEIKPWDKLHKNRATFDLSFLEIDCPLKKIKKGSPSKENGLASFLFFKEAFQEARKGKIQALVTAPISKKSWDLAGLEWRGHTDFLGQFYPQAIMAFWSEKIKIALYTHHLPLKNALKEIKKEKLSKFFLLLSKSLERTRFGEFEFLVAGLNPHAGEEGLLGSEEKEEIIPAIRKAQSKGVAISGPFPPDVVFRKALGHSEKIVIALYHDQGLIAFKLESFENGVNLTLGLPFIRTSPDHGTAFDIAEKNMANPQSMIEAIKLACELSQASFQLSP